MYGTQEHAYHVRRIEDLASTIEEACARLGVIRDELRQDELAETQGSRDKLRVALLALVQARTKIEQAQHNLPKPGLMAGLR